MPNNSEQQQAIFVHIFNSNTQLPKTTTCIAKGFQHTTFGAPLHSRRVKTMELAAVVDTTTIFDLLHGHNTHETLDFSNLDGQRDTHTANSMHILWLLVVLLLSICPVPSCQKVARESAPNFQLVNSIKTHILLSMPGPAGARLRRLAGS